MHKTLSCLLGGGEKLGRPILSPSDKVKHQPHAEGYQVGKNSCAYG